MSKQKLLDKYEKLVGAVEFKTRSKSFEKLVSSAVKEATVKSALKKET